MKNQPSQTFIINLRDLMETTNINTATLSRISGVSKRMIDYILTGERKPSIEIAGQIANAFGLNCWHIIMPSIPYNLAKSGVLDKLICDYMHCNEVSKNYISHIAERDAEYKSN